ncbi:hypothetical protein PF007_g29676 [Phytophthora fragariae]|uniref:Uncharacterized protein n=3 Tax=Phytophthora fragariae TaxID=53985 RepID=A0A6A3PPU6_9STRA|nr:hypothetical protein PF007_g29676 [Phytophthora fragariae]
MPSTPNKRHVWTVLVRAYPADDGNMLIEAMKPSKITKSQLTACNVCNLAVPHKMRVRERRCRDKACKEVSAGKPCAWYCKTPECQKLHLMTVAERGEHLTPRRGVEPVRMTAAMKAFATDLAAQGLKPSRIRNGMMTRFSLDHETLPSLQVVQRGRKALGRPRN